MEFNEYNILIAPSSEMFKQTLTVMLSAMLNCKKPCSFFIMEFNWTDEQKKYCTEFIAEYPKNSVKYIHVDDSVFNPLKAWHGYYNTYYKMLAHQYLGNDIERVLYIDTDIIINKDIYNFYSMDFEDNYIIGSCETASGSKFHKLKHSPEPGHGFINCGCILLNLNKLRDSNITIKDYYNIIKDTKSDYLADQGILSFIFRDKIKVLPSYKYNHAIFQEGEEYGYNKIFSMSPDERREKLCSAYHNEEINFEENETIIHFAGYVNKPWDCAYENIDGSESVEISYLNHGLTPDMVAPLYLKWWNIAKRLPIAIYENILTRAHKINRQAAINRIENTILLWTRNAMNFLKDVSDDYISGNLRFEHFMRSLSNKKIAVLKSGDMAAKCLDEYSSQNKLDIVFSTQKGALKDLTPDEWEKCKQADVIINCCVHGMKSEERDGISDVMIWDIVKGAVQPASADIPAASNELFNNNSKLLQELQVAILEKNKLEQQNKLLRETLKNLLD